MYDARLARTVLRAAFRDAILRQAFYSLEAFPETARLVCALPCVRCGVFFAQSAISGGTIEDGPFHPVWISLMAEFTPLRLAWRACGTDRVGGIYDWLPPA